VTSNVAGVTFRLGFALLAAVALSLVAMDRPAHADCVLSGSVVTCVGASPGGFNAGAQNALTVNVQPGAVVGTGLVINNNNGQARLLLNQARSSNRNHWLLVRLEAANGNRFGIGAKIEVRQYGRKLLRRVHTDSSYLAANDVRVHFGLGEDARVESLTVYWPDGSAEMWDRIQVDRIMTIKQGTGRSIRSAN